MGFLPKIIFILIGINIVIAKRKYYNYGSHNNYHVPWTYNYPPVISIEGVWPFGSHPDLYQYQPQPEHYPHYEEPYYNQEMLIKCLNTALAKLDKLLPKNTEETTTYASAVKPEELAVAVNHAIDRLGIHLSQKSVDATTTETSKSTIVVTESTTSAVEDLNELFTSLPEEIVNKNQNKPVLMDPSPFVSTILSPEFKPNKDKETTTTNNLFTSHIVERNKEENDINSETSKPFLSAENLGNLLTSFVTTETNFESTEINTEAIENNIVTTDVEVESTTIKNDSSEVLDIDVRFGNEKSDFIFPDQFEKLNQNKKPSIIELNTRFDTKPVANQNTPIVLEYKPSRPPFHPDVFPPHPTPRPVQNDLELIDRNKPQTQAPTSTSPPQTSIVLGFKPSRPPFHPDIFPPNPTPRPIPNDEELIDRNKPQTQAPNPTVTNLNNPTTVQPQTSIVLGFKPSRPPFHPDIFPPHPTPRPDNTATQTISPDIGDRNKVPETTTSANQYHPTHYYSTPISLEYKPTRPFYAPHPIVYPKPMIPPGTPWPAKSTERPAN